MSIIHIAVGVFMGNICTLAVLWCWKEFNRPDQENISWGSISVFLLIVGLSTALLAVQRWG